MITSYFADRYEHVTDIIKGNVLTRNTVDNSTILCDTSKIFCALLVLGKGEAMNEGKLLTAKELAERCDLPLAWVYTKAAKGVIPSYRLGKYVRFRAMDVERWLEEQRRGLGLSAEHVG
jgi:excisionase family DNA binding protein